MRFLSPLAVLCSCVAIASLVGCSDAPELSVVSAIPTTPAAPTQEEQAEEKPAAATPPPVRSHEASYTPPFTGRSELFAPPANTRRVSRRNDNNLDESVELVGFGGPGEQHVVLIIDGVVTPVALGDKQHAVEVISINGPLVVLQRGRTRWTASLE